MLRILGRYGEASEILLTALDLRKKQEDSGSPLEKLSARELEKKKNQLLKDMKAAAADLEFEISDADM